MAKIKRLQYVRKALLSQISENMVKVSDTMHDRAALIDTIKGDQLPDKAELIDNVLTCVPGTHSDVLDMLNRSEAALRKELEQIRILRDRVSEVIKDD
jgi:ABC-type transporter Mla subunit MlaD